jgi:hypothetical protein
MSLSVEKEDAELKQNKEMVKRRDKGVWFLTLITRHLSFNQITYLAAGA